MANDRNVVTMRVSDGSNVKIEYHEAVASTSLLAKKYAQAGYSDRYVVFAEKQASSSITGTRLSDGEFESGVFISLILRPSFFPSQAGLIGPLAAVALLNALSEHTTKQLGLGWVSDVYCEGVKVGGVSVEGKLDSFSAYEYLIVNFAVRLDGDNFPPRLTDMIRKVFESENLSIGMIIAKSILNKFFDVYYDIKSPKKHMNTYAQNFLLVGKRIKYLKDGKRRSCKVVGVDKDTCALEVEVSKGVYKTLTSPYGVITPKKIKLKTK